MTNENRAQDDSGFLNKISYLKIVKLFYDFFFFLLEYRKNSMTDKEWMGRNRFPIAFLLFSTFDKRKSSERSEVVKERIG